MLTSPSLMIIVSWTQFHVERLGGQCPRTFGWNFLKHYCLLILSTFLTLFVSQHFSVVGSYFSSEEQIQNVTISSSRSGGNTKEISVLYYCKHLLIESDQTRSKLGRIEHFKFHILRILLAKSFQLFCITIKSIIWEVFSVLLTSKTKSTNQDSKVKLNGPIIHPQSSREHKTCMDVSLFYPHLECVKL